MVGNVGDAGCRNSLPNAFFNLPSTGGRGSGGDEAILRLGEPLCSGEAERGLASEKRMKRAFAVAGGEDAGEVRGDQEDCSVLFADVVLTDNVSLNLVTRELDG